MNRNFTLLIVMLAVFGIISAVVAAQDATLVPTLDPAVQPTIEAPAQPTADPALQPTTDSAAQPSAPVYVGDTSQESVQIVMSYLQTRDPQLLAENAEFFDQTTGQPVVGRDAITQMQNDFFSLAFTGTLLQPITVIAADNGYVVVEFNFSGSNTGMFRNNPATNLPISVPMIGIFHVENSQIVNARLYYDVATIQTQLGLTVSVQVNPGLASGEANDDAGLATGDTAFDGNTTPAASTQNLDTVLDDPQPFYGQTITVEGSIYDMLNERMFRISDSDLIDPDELLILHSVDGDPNLAQDEHVLITGTVRPFVLTEIESEFGFDLDDALFVGYENQPVLIAESVTPVP